MNRARETVVARLPWTIRRGTRGGRLAMMLMLVIGIPHVSPAESVVKSAGKKPVQKPVSAERPVRVPQANPLDAVVQQMRSAGKRIGRQEIGPGTRRLQQQVVRDLEKLIDQVRRGQARPNRSAQPRSIAQPRSTAGRNSPQSAASSAAGGGKSRTGKSRQSSDRRNTPRRPDRQIAERRLLVKELWGHLPPALRRRLLNIGSATPLPQYEQLVRRYFESLAAQDTHKPKP